MPLGGELGQAGGAVQQIEIRSPPPPRSSDRGSPSPARRSTGRGEIPPGGRSARRCRRRRCPVLTPSRVVRGPSNAPPGKELESDIRRRVGLDRGDERFQPAIVDPDGSARPTTTGSARCRPRPRRRAPAKPRSRRLVLSFVRPCRLIMTETRGPQEGENGGSNRVHRARQHGRADRAAPGRGRA